jgi:nucleotide-binding universal stress UspA family protein
MPKTTTFKGTMANAYGSPLATPINFSGSFEELEKDDEIPAKEQLDAEELLAYVNNKRKANARQKSMQAALDAAGIEKPTLEQPEVQFKQMVKILTTAGRSEADARQMANANLGTNY